MNVEAIQKAYAALKKAGITKKPRGAFVSCVVLDDVKKYKFASLQVAILVNVLQRELFFPPFFEHGITFIEWVSMTKRGEVIYHKGQYFLNGTLKDALPKFKELLATARHFL